MILSLILNLIVDVSRIGAIEWMTTLISMATTKAPLLRSLHVLCGPELDAEGADESHGQKRRVLALIESSQFCRMSARSIA